MIFVDGPLLPFWYPFLIIGVASQLTSFLLTRQFVPGMILCILTCISYLLTTYFAFSEPSWSRVIVHSSLIIAFGVLFLRIFKILCLAIIDEYEKSIKLEKTLEELHKTQEIAEVQSRLSALGEMAGGIAHEINNPLAIIAATSSSLKKQFNKDKKSQQLDDAFFLDAIQDIDDTVARISKIIKGMKSVSTNSEGTVKRMVPLNEIISDVLNISAEKLKKNGIVLEIDMGKQDYIVSVDPVQISQVLINLLNNAYDALSSFTTSDTKWIKLEIEQLTEFILIKVIDNGPGISQENSPKIFMPFFTTKEFGKGTGLGLSISRKILEKHGGELYLDSTHAHTCFVVKLPKAHQ